MEYTKGTFRDGNTGWKAVAYNNLVGYATHEIHFSDDGECVAEVVHGQANAKLIAATPYLLGALQKAPILSMYNNSEAFIEAYEHWRDNIKSPAIQKATL